MTALTMEKLRAAMDVLKRHRVATPPLRFVASSLIGDPIEDWSNVRSPARARRRRKLGHPQRIVMRTVATGRCYHDVRANIVYYHPDDLPALDARPALTGQNNWSGLR